jgi:hypothetical protein
VQKHCLPAVVPTAQAKPTAPPATAPAAVPNPVNDTQPTQPGEFNARFGPWR